MISEWFVSSSIRAVYRVASVQPVVSTHGSVLTRSTPHLSSIPPPLPPPPLPPSIPPPQHSPQLTSLPPPIPGMPMRGPAAVGGGGGGDASSHGQPHSYHQHHLHPQSGVLPGTQLQSHSQPTSHSHSQSRSQSHPQAPSQSQAGAPEQNGILDWLRRLRLHKYYPVFKQLTMEEVSAASDPVS